MSLPLDDISLDSVAGEPKPTLNVKFFIESGKTPELTLNLPLQWNRIDSKVELPKWTREMYLLEYIPHVKDLLKKQVANLQFKQQVVEELIKAMGGSPLEVDTRCYSSLAFLCDLSQYTIVVVVSIKSTFPQDPPQITFQSFTQFVRSRPFMRAWPDCPWSPRWSALEMAKRLRSFIVEVLPIFKKHCSAL